MSLTESDQQHNGRRHLFGSCRLQNQQSCHYKVHFLTEMLHLLLTIFIIRTFFFVTVHYTYLISQDSL